MWLPRLRGDGPTVSLRQDFEASGSVPRLRGVGMDRVAAPTMLAPGRRWAPPPAWGWTRAVLWAPHERSPPARWTDRPQVRAFHDVFPARAGMDRTGLSGVEHPDRRRASEAVVAPRPGVPRARGWEAQDARA